MACVTARKDRLDTNAAPWGAAWRQMATPPRGRSTLKEVSSMLAITASSRPRRASSRCTRSTAWASPHTGVGVMAGRPVPGRCPGMWPGASASPPLPSLSLSTPSSGCDDDAGAGGADAAAVAPPTPSSEQRDTHIMWRSTSALGAISSRPDSRNTLRRRMRRGMSCARARRDERPTTAVGQGSAGRGGHTVHCVLRATHAPRTTAAAPATRSGGAAAAACGGSA